ncbi:MAG: hypothetical protein NXI08_04445 [bacterium]|nr:hypothetical protein [bacterium]
MEKNKDTESPANSDSRNNLKKTLLSSLSQVFLIVFSVVLGLILTEKIEDRKNEKDAQLLLSKINAELKQNKIILDNWVPYHLEIANALDSLVINDSFLADFSEDRAALYQVFSRGTLIGETPVNDAWDIAKNHPLIVNFEFDELLALSKIYNQQDLTYESLGDLIGLLLSPNLNSQANGSENLLLFRNQFREFTMRQVQLSDYYTEGEKILNYTGN